MAKNTKSPIVPVEDETGPVTANETEQEAETDQTPKTIEVPAGHIEMVAALILGGWITTHGGDMRDGIAACLDAARDLIAANRSMSSRAGAAVVTTRH